MLPLSIHQRALAPRAPVDALLREVRWRPSNIPVAVGAELRAVAAWIGVFVLAGVVVALAWVWVRLRVVEVGYRLSVTRQLVERLEQEGQELATAAAATDTPGRLEQEAQRRLGLQRPEHGQDARLP
jgi:hypothetical protein